MDTYEIDPIKRYSRNRPSATRFNSFTMPIKGRIDMLATGIRTPVGIKVMGPELAEVERIGLEPENYLRDIPGTRSVYAERVTTGYFLYFSVHHDAIARYGLTVESVNEVIQTSTAVGQGAAG
ncbi:efflux RND transporter permease subunit [Desulfopila aestuarii]|uniref:Cu(I)/Ag(I) efflux system membrane protein CusA/SilA n=1 Tax=Desulfopila aestuarii DSM 18488 TaxID=1121416 RepID=A0A1M7YIE2_9BACT|nr:efflux RND transporter permease subunit [Desulfopila aestuarii]SHO52298.1 Cu(I)/Ag(I) efflux system membrane protein CusA/SilA [Desulfopila aestuarii DSM 18488]